MLHRAHAAGMHTVDVAHRHLQACSSHPGCRPVPYSRAPARHLPRHMVPHPNKQQSLGRHHPCITRSSSSSSNSSSMRSPSPVQTAAASSEASVAGPLQDIEDADLDMDDNIISLDDEGDGLVDDVELKAALLQAQQEYLGDIADGADRTTGDDGFWSQEKERVFLVGVTYKNWNNPQQQQQRKKQGSTRRPAAQRFDVHSSLDELARLADTAGLKVVGSTYQALEAPNAASYIGSGKVAEVAAAVRAYNVETVIFDDELSAAQLRNLEKAFKASGGSKDGAPLEVSVCDRTALILDIFNQRARTREGKLQVELAQLEYQLPRLTRMWSHLDRVGGGGQVKGTGEKQIEIDKRLLRDKAATLRRELAAVRTHRAAYRERRSAAPIPVVALVGYTNAGKSTLLNTLTAAGVLAEDKLFATLDPTTRKVRLPGNFEVLLSDTVGFIQKLPTQLVAAFRATLEEIQEASLIVHVLDASADNAAAQCNTVLQVLDELGVSDIPLITAWNKADAVADPEALQQLAAACPNTAAVSGATGQGLQQLLEVIASRLEEAMVDMELLLPYSAGDLLDDLHRTGRVHSTEYTEVGTKLAASVPKQLVGVLQQYSTSSTAGQTQSTAEQQELEGLASTAGAAGENGSNSYASDDGEDDWDGDYDEAAWGPGDSDSDPDLAAARAAVLTAGQLSSPSGDGEQPQQRASKRRRNAKNRGSGDSTWIEKHQLPTEWTSVVHGAGVVVR